MAANQQSLGPFEIIQKVGQGGMAEVFKARAFGASGFEKLIALKALLSELIGEGQYERMFIEEARLQARLSHPNLLQAHDLGTAEGRLWVRLDWVEGGNLSSLSHGKPLPIELALRVVEKIAQGLAALHQAVDEGGRPLGLVHRDVSPSNILVSRDGEVKLADFGITKATMQRDQTRAGVRKGTYAYMSPEQVSGFALTPASDQFALGATLVELLTGASLFEGATPMETMDRVRAAEPPELADFPLPVRLLAQRLLKKDARARFGGDDQLLEGLAELRRTSLAPRRALADWVQLQAGQLDR